MTSRRLSRHGLLWESCVLVCALLLGACGGGGTGPTPTDPPAVVVQDGITRGAVSATVTPATPSLGARISVHASGYLPREQRFDGSPVMLWPGDEAYVMALVYGPPFNLGRMVRWTSGFTMAMAAADAAAQAVLEQAAAEASRATGLAVIAGPAGAVTVSVDPASPDLAGNACSTVLRLQGDAIVGARIVCESRAAMLDGNRLLHEVGHALGLGHVSDPASLMDTARADRATRAFSAREAVSLGMMYRHRQPGNLPPDRQP